jgi:polyisoprenyl-teichoic acid--peptidoglycan teichoic acid transferase
MDDEKTLEFPPRRRPQPSDDSEATQKLPPLQRGRLVTGSRSAPSRPAPPRQSALELEYEQTWEGAATGPANTPSAPYPASPSPRRIHKSWPSWRRLLIACLLLLLIIAGGGLAYGYYYFQTNIQAPLSQFIHTVSRGQDEPAGSVILPDSSVSGRTWNVLLLGSDNDGKYNFPAVLTQVMMIVHIDTVQNSVTLVSIPRDSWVYVPEVGGMHKIDQAFLLGAAPHNSFDDGVRLARLTVEQDYGITIDRYAWVGLDGFSKVIDTLGGIDVDVAHPIVDDNYPDDTGANAGNPYAYTRLDLAPGPQHLNGHEALEYVRSRHADLVGDIGRTQRQQQILQALKLKLSIGSVLGNLSHIFADLKGSVYTDFSEQEMLGFASYGQGLSATAVQRLILGPGSGSQDYGDYGTVYDPSVGGNQDVVIPHCDTIQPAINSVFGLGFAQSCNVTGP